MGVLKFLAIALIMGSAFCPARAASQPKPQPPNEMDILNKEAGASDPEGIHKYSENLIHWLDWQIGSAAGQEYEASVIDRLARAELKARQGKRKLISEAEIAQAFNQLMRETGAPDTFTADVAAVESARSESEKQLPALITRKKNGSYCNPGETIHIFMLLIHNVARPPEPPIQGNLPQVRVARFAPVQQHLRIYFARHSVPENKTVLNHLFNAFQI
jgi:hypothetical protein